MFWRRRRPTFLHPTRDLREIYGAATASAGSHGTDSLDLLTAAVGSGALADAMRRRGIDPAVVVASAERARLTRQPSPGLTDDARRIVETVSHLALEGRRDPSGPDLLVALATTDTPARAVLNSLGIDETRLRTLSG